MDGASTAVFGFMVKHFTCATASGSVAYSDGNMPPMWAIACREIKQPALADRLRAGVTAVVN